MSFEIHIFSFSLTLSLLTSHFLSVPLDTRPSSSRALFGIRKIANGKTANSVLKCKRYKHDDKINSINLMERKRMRSKFCVCYITPWCGRYKLYSFVCNIFFFGGNFQYFSQHFLVQMISVSFFHANSKMKCGGCGGLKMWIFVVIVGLDSFQNHCVCLVYEPPNGLNVCTLSVAL